MPPRKASAKKPKTSGSNNRRKRRRDSDDDEQSRQGVIGKPSADDNPSARLVAQSYDVSSVRTLPSFDLPALTTLCARVIVANFRQLFGSSEMQEATKAWLQTVPDHLIPKLFAMLRVTIPDFLNGADISTYFMRGPAVVLTRELPGVSKRTIEAIGRLAGANLVELELISFSDIAESVFVGVLPKLPSLKKLNLRGCSKVTALTVTTASASCASLISLNVSYTAVNPTCIATYVSAHSNVEVLKLAGLANWTDGPFTRILDAVKKTVGGKLPNLHTLKFRQTSLSEISIVPLIKLTPRLKRLDLSFTRVRHLYNWSPEEDNIPPLEKLSLTATPVLGAEIVTMLSHTPRLRTLSLGGLRSAMSSISATMMTPTMLRDLTNVMAELSDLENVVLVGNTAISGPHVSAVSDFFAISDFLHRVGRRCKMVNLAAIPNLCSYDLNGLLADDPDEPPPTLETLVLNNTSVGDEAAAAISSCSNLRTLELAGTQFTSDGLFTIINACPRLEKLNLTSCRGIRVTARRRFFEIWEEERNDQ